MDNLLRKRAMAISITMAMLMVAFIGMNVYADVEPPLVEPTVTVTDTFAPADDMNAYVGDMFHFTVDGYGMAHNNSNISVEITIGPLSAVPMTWNGTEMVWEYSFPHWPLMLAPIWSMSLLSMKIMGRT